MVVTPKQAKLIAIPPIERVDSEDRGMEDSVLSIPCLTGVRFLKLKDIVYLEASGSYTIVTLVSGEHLTISKPMSRFEEKLAFRFFYRVHRSYIVNILHVTEYCSKNGDFVVMSNSDRVLISRHRLQAFLNTVTVLLNCIKI